MIVHVQNHVLSRGSGGMSKIYGFRLHLRVFSAVNGKTTKLYYS